MEITTAIESDLPEIIALLKTSLGERLLPKSEAFFIWKHHKNPFGKSKILIAREGSQMVGLRAFMHWQWVSKRSAVSAVRAVDTATDPAFQGKGIFRKLTLQAVEECREEGIEMVFNSPNPISLQGYLKMGWSVAGKMPVLAGIGSLMPHAYSNELINKVLADYELGKLLEAMDPRWKVEFPSTILHTPISHKYIQWRYHDCPVVKYGGWLEPGKFGIIFRIKKWKWFMEMRICEAWIEPSFTGYEEVNQVYRNIISAIKPLMVTSAPSPLLGSMKKFPWQFGPYQKGPITTIRPLALENLESFKGFHQWSPSIGSLELF